MIFLLIFLLSLQTALLHQLKANRILLVIPLLILLLILLLSLWTRDISVEFLFSFFDIVVIGEFRYMKVTILR
jgi:hypothetical protein